MSYAEDGGMLVLPRAEHSATLLNDGRVLLLGGYVAPGDIGAVETASCELYDPATNSWSATSSMSVTRVGAGSVLLLDGRVLAMGSSGLS